jgi:hypothetical protein
MRIFSITSESSIQAMISPPSVLTAPATPRRATRAR